MRLAAVDADRPQVAFGGEDEVVAMERGIGVVAAMQVGRISGVSGGGKNAKGCGGREVAKGWEGKHSQ